MRRLSAGCAAAALAASLVAGCFDEPVKADGRVAPESRIYLKDGKLEKLTAAFILRDGLDANGVKLEGRFASIDPAKVEYLNLDRNALEDVDVLSGFTALRWLRLNGNRLEKLPDLSALKSLESVHLQGNRFREVPQELAALPKLAVLDLSSNPISRIPDWLAKKKGMRHLNLSRTAIKSLPEDLSAWESLNSLQLGDLRELGESEMRRVRAALPRTRIVY